MKKIGTILALGVAFLLGSKAGPKPYAAVKRLATRLRHTAVVSRPIEGAANHAADIVRERGMAVTDRMAEATYRSIAGSEPIEATVVDVYDAKD
ncbi:hypothetical protein U6G28_04205 [Actinomycetaceae bacterium MB13-C1-2]|nr:hypothetical protein U6G28_04205 [Actinomycetaceae bacterium MB13-C1-2]